jgi:ABC-type bacteriocin/lantibiotic exporter with double-glycine peptidase domain
MTYIAAFIVGIVIGFVRSWRLTLVILSLLPLSAILGAMFGKVMASAATQGAASYAAAGGVAEESIASIRTVTSLNGQGSAFSMCVVVAGVCGCVCAWCWW